VARGVEAPELAKLRVFGQPAAGLHPPEIKRATPHCFGSDTQSTPPDRRNSATINCNSIGLRGCPDSRGFCAD
jgi:hypothetical protein